MSIRRKLATRRLPTILATLPMIAIRSVAVAALAISVPLLGGRTAVSLARTAGWLAGRVQGLCGYRSRLYERITGY